MKDPTAAEMRDFLATVPFAAEFDEFDREEAIYWFANDYHNGQGSDLYSALCMSEYRPGRLTRAPATPILYDMLVSEFAS